MSAAPSGSSDVQPPISWRSPGGCSLPNPPKPEDAINYVIYFTVFLPPPSRRARSSRNRKQRSKQQPERWRSLRDRSANRPTAAFGVKGDPIPGVETSVSGNSSMMEREDGHGAGTTDAQCPSASACEHMRPLYRYSQAAASIADPWSAIQSKEHNSPVNFNSMRQPSELVRNSSFVFTEIVYSASCPASLRGRTRRHDVECGMRWTHHGRWTNGCKRTVKSCGPGVPVLAPRSLNSTSSATDGGNQAGPQGERV